MKPRASMGPPALPTPTARRKSVGQSTNRPLSDTQTEGAISEFKAAMAIHHPASFASPSATATRAALGRSSVPSSSLPATRNISPLSPSRSRPKTPSSLNTAQSQRSAALSTSAVSPATVTLGDPVKAAGHEGVLRYLGAIDGKAGIFAGIELTGTSRGQGKNDGSVEGKAYFTCDALCGLFVPSSKIQALLPRPTTPVSATATASAPRPSASTPSRLTSQGKSSAEAAKAMEAKITQGSRAHKYIGMTAAQLAGRQHPLKTSTSPTKRPMSPQKAPGTPLSQSVTTPRPKPRISGAAPTPRSVSYSGRKSIGGTGTPTPKLGGRRPSSTLANGSETPEVPPLPPSYASGRMTPSRRSGDMNPFGSPSESSRPMTPARSVSRSSQTSGYRPQSSLTRSGRSSAVDDDRDWQAVQAEKLAAVSRADEAKAAQIEAEKAVKINQSRFEELRLRLEGSEARIKELEASLAAATAANDELARSQSQAQETLRKLETQVAESDIIRERLEEQAASAVNASAAGRIDTKRELENVRAAFERERRDLNAQIDQLRDAGNAICGVYEERLAAAAESRRQVESALRQAEDARDSAKVAAASAAAAAAVVPQAESSPSALAIDNETLKVDIEHLRERLRSTEDSLEEARAHLESEMQTNRQKRHESGDAATLLKNEVKQLKDRIELSAQKEFRTAIRVTELELALKESNVTLEAERMELESLRAEATTSASVETLQKQIDAMRKERDAARADAKSAQSRLADAEEELRLNEELREADNSPLTMRSGLNVNGDHLTPTRPRNLTSPDGQDVASLRAQHERELQARDTEIGSLRARLATSLNSESTSLRAHRDSASSSISGRSLVSPSAFKDEAAIVRDQLAGLKVIVGQLTDENTELANANKHLKRELDAARSVLPKSNDALLLPGDTNDLRRRLEDAEKQAARDIKALNQEVADLESLVEAKIFREDELTDEVDRYRRLLEKAEQAGFVAAGSSSSRDSGRSSANRLKLDNSNDSCELCGDSSHQIDKCPLMSTGTAASLGNETFCEDCAEYGHTPDACPNALETF